MLVNGLSRTYNGRECRAKFCKRRTVIDYPIGAVTRMTGIPLDTLRAWERRHGVVRPRRSARGRLYSESQIRRLLLLRTAVDRGYAIGQLAGMGDSHLRKVLDTATALSEARPEEKSPSPAAHLRPILEAVDQYDYAKADRELGRLAVAVGGPRDLVHRVALPLMRTVGAEWHEGKMSIAQEHMTSSLLCSLLSAFIRSQANTKPPARVLFATPSNEHHGFPNLAGALLASAGGLGVIHLGTDVPAGDIVVAARKSGADAVLLSVSSTLTPETVQQCRHLSKNLREKVVLWLGSPQELHAENLLNGTRFRFLNDFLQLEQQLAGLGATF